jgi:ribosome-binding factor A
MMHTGSSATPRAARVAAQVQRSLALLLRRGLRDPRVGNVTVTTVNVAPDLTVARVQVLPFAAGTAAAEQAAPGQSAAQRAEEALAGLRSAAGYLRGEVARELKLRHAPRLEFELDVELDQAHHVTELIEHALRADQAAAVKSAHVKSAHVKSAHVKSTKSQRRR